MVVFELPWPEACLSQNSRGHWATSVARKKKARVVARRICSEALKKNSMRKPGQNERLGVDMVFCAPLIKRRRDIQNLIGAMKYAVDGIADAVCIDDSEFNLSFNWGEPVEGGTVITTLCVVNKMNNIDWEKGYEQRA